ncbi:hypothetical protein GGQ69_000486 [Micrococcus sp. TA1]|nr:hypothetical protein [Micrococcus sp. TA1]
MRANHQITHASGDHAGVLPVRYTRAAATVAAVETTGR